MLDLLSNSFETCTNCLYHHGHQTPFENEENLSSFGKRDIYLFILIFLLYIHVDNIVINNLRSRVQIPADPSKQIISFFLLHHYIIFFIIKYLNPLKIGKKSDNCFEKGSFFPPFFFFLNSACFPYIRYKMNY